ncbi:hypothetical protein AJ80_01818 [Polytolypa hystricis UAMH7299]|uniref:Amidohydrolase-related domain-containing protein n=1 Tax=Polytolypa hystricis (strain UAMH7299) TaxID=1447883 RepID=A0A2B7YR63_POLH7|nr:hypothetical protein AJ80_01818 [Polytolypa hystricis UAMH7299]
MSIKRIFLIPLHTLRSAISYLSNKSLPPKPSLSPAPISHRVPANSWDSHMHILDPQHYPLSPDAQYTPTTPHLLSHALSFESSIGIPNLVLVQPSIYGSDNSCLLDGLRSLGPQRGRGVVTIDPSTTIESSTLHEWHTLGVRGVRLNFQSVNKTPTAAELASTLRAHAAIVQRWDWVFQIYISLDAVPVLVDVVRDLPVRVCLDHFASPRLRAEDSVEGFDPYTSLPGFVELVSLLKQGNTYVKISAPYRLSAKGDDEGFRATGVIAKELMRVARDRVVFATDWPHTRFEGLDIRPFMEMCLRWCEEVEAEGGKGDDGETGLVEMLFRENAKRLWDG